MNKETKITDRELKKNAEGYSDPTAYKAIKNLEFNEIGERRRKLIGCIYRICELSGFSLESRVKLKDVKTGKIFE